jgi:hypothetical protein
MNERLLAYTFSIADPTEGAAVGALACYFMLPFGATLIYASAAPFADDPGLTMDLNDDGSAIIAAMVCATKAAPGEWISTHAGGTETPVAIAAGSEMTVDFNNAANGNRVDVVFLFLTGESWG